MIAQRILVRVRRCWAVKTAGFDGLAILIAKTEAGARGFAKMAIEEAGYCHGGHLEETDFEVWAIPAMDNWAKNAEIGRAYSIDTAVREAMELAASRGRP